MLVGEDPVRKSRTMATGAACRRAHNGQRPSSGLTIPYPSRRTCACGFVWAIGESLQA